MIFRAPTLCLILILFGCSGGDLSDHEPEQLDNSLKEDHFLVNARGDTLPTGVPLPLNGKIIHPDSFPPPVYTPLQSPPSVVPAHNNRIPAGAPKIVTVPDQLDHFVPGENGLIPPVRVPATGRIVPALQAEPVLALPAKVSENALFDIKNLDVEQGLKASSVYSILEDSRGSLWFGALGGGVSRYDGTRFWHFTTEEGLINDDVVSSAEDSFGNLWFGTWGGGVCRYDGQNFTHYAKEEGLNGNKVWAIFKDSRDILWFGTDGGLTRFHPDENGRGEYFTHYTVENGLGSNVVRAIVEDNEGNLWLGTDGGGVIRMEWATDKSEFTNLTSREGLSDDIVWSLAIDEKDHLWIGTHTGGINRYDGEKIWQFTKEQGLSSDEVWAMDLDQDGNLWMGTEGGGVVKYEANGEWGTFTTFTTREGLSRNIGISILVDKRGGIWAGTAFDGVNLYRENGFTYFNLENGLSHNEIRSILEDREGNIWLGTWGGGVCRYNDGNFMYLTTSEGLISNFVSDIIQDKHGRFWFSTNGGVQSFDGEGFLTITDKEGLTDNRTIFTFEDQQDRIWISTVFVGMNRYLPGNGHNISKFENFTTKEGMASDNVWAMVNGPGDRIWFGNWGGGLGSIFFPEKPDTKEQVTYYTIQEGLADNEIWSLFTDSEDVLWIGTNNSLNFLYTSDEKVQDTPERASGGLSFGVVRELENRFITGVLEDAHRNLWISTQKDIMVFTADQRDSLVRGIPLQGSHFFTLGQEDGLKKLRIEANGDNAIIDSKNRIWLGSTDGISVLDLNRFKIPTEAPTPPSLNHLAIDQQFVDYRKIQDAVYSSEFPFGKVLAEAVDSVSSFFNYPLGLSLPHHINNLTFNFSAIDWNGPHKLQYSYLLEGLEENWSPPNAEPSAIYRSLPPGDYTFKVKAIGAAGKWSEPFKYNFAILPPWWLSWWAYAFYTLAFLAILAGLYLYQRRRWMLQTELKVEQEKAQRLQELDHFKSRFYTNITHEFRTPLTVIKGMAGQIKDDGKIRDTIQRNSDRLVQMVNQLLDLSKLEQKSLPVNWIQSDIIPYLRYLTESCHSLAVNKHISLAFFSRNEQIIMDFDEAKVQQILLNLLSNAIKFTPEYGSVKVIADRVEEKSQSQLEITVKDTGAGIAEDQLPHIFDRFYQGDNSTTRRAEGSGIGLALVWELVQLLDGSIEVASRVEEGTTFKLYLPIHQNASEKTPGELAAVQTPFNGDLSSENRVYQANTTNGEQPMVLIIEDNADVVEYLFTCLAGRYQHQAARNGKVGLEMALELIPDVIISDVMMPEMDGFEVCKQLKADRRTSHIPIILLTAKAEQDDKVAGLTQGADAYLTKPFDQEELLVRLEKLASLSKQLSERLTHTVEKEETLSPAERQEAAFLGEVNEIITANMENELFDTNFLCREVAMSRAQLHRKLKALTGESTARYIRRNRLQRAKKLLETTDLPIGEISVKVGFKDFSHFSRSFAQEFELTPSETRK